MQGVHYIKDLYSRKDLNLVLSRVARFYATRDQKLIHSYWNALRIHRKINQLHQVCVMHCLYTTLHKTILGFADIGSMEKFFWFFSVSPLIHVKFKKKYSRVSYIWKHIKNDKTKKPITTSFVLYIEYTFIHFGMSISCKQGSLLISK